MPNRVIISRDVAPTRTTFPRQHPRAEAVSSSGGQFILKRRAKTTNVTSMDDAPTTKDYIDRSMDAVRAQNDARFAEMLSEIKSVHVDMNARLSAISADIHALTLTTQNSLEASREAKQAANAAETVSRGAADLARTHNWNILMAMIAVVAVILALGGLWMTAMQTVRSLTG